MVEKGVWKPNIGISWQNEAFFERLAKVAREFVFVVDVTQMRYQYVSESAIKFLGCTRDLLMDADGMDFVIERMHPLDRSEFKSRLEDLVQSSCQTSEFLDDPEFTEFNYRQSDAGGRLHRLNCRSTVFERTTDGHVSQILLISNVTSCDQPEETQCIDSFRAFFEHITEAFYLHRHDGVILDMNRHAHEVLGYRRDELIGMSISHFDPTISPERLNEIGKQLAVGQIVSFESCHRRKNGTEFPVAIQIHPFTFGGQRYAVSIADNMTERLRIEAVMSTHSQIFCSMSEAVGLSDIRGVLVETNPALDAMFGYDAGELIGAHVTVLNDATPNENERIVTEIFERVQENQYWEGEFRNRRKDGTVFYTRARIKPINSHGQACWLCVQEDITERRKAEQQILASNRRLRQMIDSFYGFFGIFTIDGVTLDLNDNAVQATGMPRKELLGQKLVDSYWCSFSEDVQELTRIALDRAAAGETFRFEAMARVNNGKLIYVDAMFGPVFNESGDVEQIIGFALNINDRKKAEETLIESEKLLRTAQRIGKLGFGDWNLSTNELSLSDEALSIFGLNQRKISFDEFSLRVFPEDRERVAKSLKNAIAGIANHDMEHRILRSNGETAWVKANAELLFDGQVAPFRLFGTILDITQQKQAELQSLEIQLRLRQAQTMARIGNWENDLVTGQIWWSDHVYDIFGIAPSKFGATYKAFLELIHPDDRDMVNGAYVRSLRTREPYRVIYRLKLAVGSVKFVEECCETEFAVDGTPLISRGTVQDVTERRLLIDDLQRSLREKETLLREVHHRVKNNLQIISSLLYLQSQKLEDRTGRAIFDDAQTRLRSMMLVHEKLYQSKNLAEVDFSDYVKSLVQHLTSMFRAQLIQWKVETVPLLLPLEKALPSGMILVELVTNVLKHAFIDGQRGEGQIRLVVESSRVILTVSDNGVGLPDDFVPEKSSGMGWQLICNLTFQLDGTITVKRGNGAHVAVSFLASLLTDKPNG